MSGAPAERDASIIASQAATEVAICWNFVLVDHVTDDLFDQIFFDRHVDAGDIRVEHRDTTIAGWEYGS